ncbi:MAG: membrane dipeptidase [Tannerella sp.]|jgi:microsomal dipeptidase-like Zn-dependent dipeptidase/gamma-glutamyl-gamma-aminobutyrate hydrolase PuuD|nr:membrane dipeptidase [Tannerella sp.]
MKHTLLLISLLLLGYLDANGQEFSPNLTDLNRMVDSCSIDAKTERQPLIGVSASRTQRGGSTVSGTYINAILKAGGIPVIVPVITDVKALRHTVSQLDGLVMTGGEDFSPFYYKEDTIAYMNETDSIRDIYDLALLKLVADRNIPILGICRGEQAINVAFGGTLYQDIPTQYPSSDIKHRQVEPSTQGTHWINTIRGTQLSAVLPATRILTNTHHHQGVKDVAPYFGVSARASDGFVEAIEAYPNKSVMGVQFHPEGHVAGGDTAMLNLFKHIVREAQLYNRAKELHHKMLTIDTHCDAPSVFVRGNYDVGKRERNQVNLPKMEEGMLDAVFMACYVGQSVKDDTTAVARIEQQLDAIYQQVEQNRDKCGIAITSADLILLKQSGKKAFFIGIENGYGIGRSLANLRRFHQRGVNYMTLCHMRNNDICDSSGDTVALWRGLSPFGRKVVKLMNRIGMMVDVSHVSDKAFYDVIRLSSMPVIASHSSARALCGHARNLTDEQLRALARNGGVAQICILDEFINDNPSEADLQGAIEHILHAVSVCGIDHVGIASDFDGGGGVIGCNGSNDMISITIKLLEKGYSDEDIAKIWGGNLLRVMQRVQRQSRK